MTAKKGKDDLGSVLGSLRKERGGKLTGSPTEETTIPPTASKVREPREAREAFTSRLRPSQRRWLKRWGADLEEETNQRITVEDILEILVTEIQEDEALRARVADKLADR